MTPELQSYWAQLIVMSCDELHTLWGDRGDGVADLEKQALVRDAIRKICGIVPVRAGYGACLKCSFIVCCCNETRAYAKP